MKRTRTTTLFPVALSLFAAICFSTPAAFAQCVVTTQQELLDALACVANPNCTDCNTCTQQSHGCPEIIINTNMNVNTEIDIGAAHEGLTLTINGTITWNGSGSLTGLLFDVHDTANITIRGSGHVTSTSTPPALSVTAVSVVGVDGITIEGLTFTKLNWGVNVRANVQSKNITLTDLVGDHFVDYGVWIGVQNAPMVENTTITNCHFSRPIEQYPFRIYSHNTTVMNCSGMDSGSSLGGKAGIWIVEGDNILIDGFTTNRHIRIGPNWALEPDEGERLRCARIFNVVMDNIPSSDPQKHLFLFPGVLGCYLENIEPFAGMTINLGPNGLERPFDRIHWRDLNGPVTIDYSNSLLCDDVSPCVGDVDNDDVVDVNDLLAVINAWGACPPPSGQTECYECLPDIYPFHCGDAQVNVSDLLAVISDWGCTPSTPGDEDNAPKSIQDCWDRTVERYPNTGSQEFHDAYEACIDSLCEAGTIDCD